MKVESAIWGKIYRDLLALLFDMAVQLEESDRQVTLLKKRLKKAKK